MDSADESAESNRGQPSKVPRLLEAYELQELGAELERRWTAEEDRWSLRELTDYFNRQLLNRALTKADVQLLEGELENIYRLLTDEDVSSADRTRARRRLEREGLDVDELEADFVSYQAIRTYLKKHRGAEYTPGKTDPLQREATHIQQLRGRIVSVVEGKLEQLHNAGQLTIGEFHILADIQVVCEDCNTQFEVLKLLKKGGCNCDE